jgi:two-component system phosphate regulon sensor histidine kinase PhoR
MQEQANRMSRLIDDLLSLSRLEMRSMSDDAQTFDLAAVASEVIDSMQPVAAESGVEIERRFGKGAFQVRGMRDELVQVIENLVENACKYGKSGKKVIIESFQRARLDDSTEIMLSVRDFGPGIEPEHLPRLTERFYRANSQSAYSPEGHRASPGHRQAHCNPASGTAFDKLQTGQRLDFCHISPGKWRRYQKMISNNSTNTDA